MEQWKQIDGYENYEVSTEGNVRNTNYNRTGKTKQMTKCDDGNGYDIVCLSKNGQQKSYSVHRLVAIAFIPNPNDYTEVNHINENKKDNRVENLEWCDKLHNINHGTRTERTFKRVKCIETGKIYDSVKQASEETGINYGNISSVCNGKRKSCGGLHFEYAD